MQHNALNFLQMTFAVHVVCLHRLVLRSALRSKVKVAIHVCSGQVSITNISHSAITDRQSTQWSVEWSVSGLLDGQLL